MMSWVTLSWPWTATFLLLSSACRAERGLRGDGGGGWSHDPKSAVNMTLRITVFDDLIRQEDESITHVEHVMAIPIEDGGVESPDFYSIELPPEMIANHTDLIEEGRLFLFVQGAHVGTDTIALDDDAVLHQVQNPANTRSLRRDSSETRRVMVLRVSVATGPFEMRQVAYSSKQIYQHMFENAAVSLKQQIERCSGGKVKIQPQGVVDVTIPGQASDYNSPAGLRNTALKMIAEHREVRSAKDLAEHVIVILPPSEFSGFVGTAGVNHWLSTLNNLWSLDVMVFMHELGHNLGLNHAYLSDRSFDFSSYMSATGYRPNLEGPLKCFNAASNRQMGFFEDRTEAIDLNKPLQSITLAAFSEATKPYDRDPVIITVGPYSLQYNFASEFNRGTEILRNQVTVAHAAPGRTIVEKEGLAPQGRIFAVDDLAGTGKIVRIEACQEVTGNKKTPNSMILAILLDMVGSPCDILRQSSTLTQSPTDAPTPSPTSQPTKSPTSSPTEEPTPSPITACPDTSQVVVYFIGGGRRKKHKSFTCAWISKRTRRRRRRRHFCNNKLQQGNGRVSDICQNECGTCHPGKA